MQLELLLIEAVRLSGLSSFTEVLPVTVILMLLTGNGNGNLMMPMRMMMLVRMRELWF